MVLGNWISISEERGGGGEGEKKQLNTDFIPYIKN